MLHGVDLTKERVSEVISEIFLDSEDLSPFSRFNEMVSVDCQKITPPGKMDVEEVDEVSKTKKEK